LFSRARKHITENRPRYKPSPETHRQLLDKFWQATGAGDLDGLIQLLSEDVVMWADGGGKTRGAALHPLRGREAVAQFVAGSVRFAPPNLRPEITIVNGEQAAILRTDNAAFLVLFIEDDQSMIRKIRIVGNPDKLKWVNDPKDDQA
jgi:RNA polymerase sigma-70 factor (ECF subfamily)